MKKVSVVDVQVEKIVNRIIGGKYETNIFSKLYEIEEQVRNYSYKIDKRRKSYFYDYSLVELRMMFMKIGIKLLKEINKQENSYLKIIRILEALNIMGKFDKVKMMKKLNNKVKFCIEFYSKTVILYDSTEEMFKVIALLDKK